MRMGRDIVGDLWALLIRRAEYVAVASIAVAAAAAATVGGWTALGVAAAGGAWAAWVIITLRADLGATRSEVEGLNRRVAFAESRGVHEDWETGFGNRRQLEGAWSRCWARYRRRREVFALAMFEIIDTTRPNKALTPAVLALATSILKGVTRAEDTVARMEGRVFVVLLSNTGLDGAESLVGRVHARLEGLHRTAGGDVNILIRHGAAACTDRTTTLDDLLLAASFDLHDAPPKTLADAWAA